jgi:hypothetical protein
LKRLRAERQVVDGDGSGDASGERPDLALAAPRSGPTPKRKAKACSSATVAMPEEGLEPPTRGL